MARFSDPRLLRAEGAMVPWSRVFQRQETHARRRDVDTSERRKQVARWLERRATEVQLRWMCAPRLGIAPAPFTVWTRPPRDRVEGVEAELFSTSFGPVLFWGGELAAVVEVECTVADAGRHVGLLAMLDGTGVDHVVGADSATGTGGARVRLRVRCSGANLATLTNAHGPSVRIARLVDVVNDPAWERIERVGLPTDEPWSGTTYDPRDQGFVHSPTDAVSAALERLDRGMPFFGWDPATDVGGVAPPWQAPDPTLLVEETREELLPLLEPAFDPGVATGDQHELRHDPPVDPPHQGGATSTLPTEADMPLLSLLQLPASADPSIALATGFGTAYGPKELDGFGEVDFLVTADYDDTPRRTGPVEMAAFVPAPELHQARPVVVGVRAERQGLVRPDVRDDPWRETVRVSWNRPLVTAALGRDVGAALVRYEPDASAPPQCLLPPRASGGWRPLLPGPDGPEGQPGHDRSAVVDAAAPIAIGSGGRDATYAVANQDVWGIWSPWASVPHHGPEPAVPLPRVVSLRLDTSYAGSSTCPSEVVAEVAIDWADRTHRALEVSLHFFPMPDPDTPPPSPSPPAVAPPGTFTRLVSIPFSDDAFVAPAGVTVEALSGSGDAVVLPGPAQGDESRRYLVTVPVPTLDFGATPRWGVRAWARSELTVVTGTGAWAPGPATPAVAVAASPVPVLPLLPPPLPGVPLASTSDAQGHSHARLTWSLPAGADARHIVVWEVAETALRQRAGLAPRAAEGTVPGARLVELRNAYDGMTPVERQSAFRRFAVLPGTAREHDAVLPKGSTDIHLFAITVTTSSGVEGPWPLPAAPAEPHEALHAIMAPRVVEPAAPRVESAPTTSGWSIRLTTTSHIPVTSFDLFRTRLDVAARSVDTMGTRFARVTATTFTDPTVDARVAGSSYEASWSGAFPPSWEPWSVRAVAVPLAVEPQLGMRGQRSASSPLVSIVSPVTAPPNLEPLVASVWGPANDGVVVRSATDSPLTTPFGPHRLGATISGSPVAADLVPLGDLVEDTGSPPASWTTDPLLVRAPRSGGETPLALWFRRADPSQEVDVTMAIVDPRGRRTERTLTVPPWLPPEPDLHLVDSFEILGRGRVVLLRSAEDPLALPPFTLFVHVASRAATWPWFLRGRAWSLEVDLPDVPTGTGPRVSSELGVIRQRGGPPHDYAVLVPTTGPIVFTARLVSPDRSGATQVRGSYR